MVGGERMVRDLEMLQFSLMPNFTPIPSLDPSLSTPTPTPLQPSYYRWPQHTYCVWAKKLGVFEEASELAGSVRGREQTGWVCSKKRVNWLGVFEEGSKQAGSVRGREQTGWECSRKGMNWLGVFEEASELAGSVRGRVVSRLEGIPLGVMTSESWLSWIGRAWGFGGLVWGLCLVLGVSTC
eukprot:358430-Chlamydomonas_euryale.AAC.1